MNALPRAFRPGQPARKLVSGLALAGWLLLTFLSSSPLLHGWLHKDSQAVDHSCVVTQAGEVAVEPASPELHRSVRPDTFLCFLPRGIASHATGLEAELPASRGPPASISFLKMAG